MPRTFSAPCPTCEHQSTGTVVADIDGAQRIRYDPPPSTCDCRCHEPWRIMHRTPAVATEAVA